MSPDDGSTEEGGSERSGQSLAEQLLTRAMEPLGMVLLTRERIQQTLEDAVQRGRVTRKDANELAGELVRRGRQQTEEVVSELERLLGGGRGRIETAGRRSRDSVGRIARTADRTRRTVTGAPGGAPIPDYDTLTARQVQGRLGELTPGQLRQLHEHERRHANRKTVLDAIERALD
ncbi:MAG TPA: hypothetical protein VE992_04825 [Solirubrobacteraceae bacterium]|nr:hypothetical protein [Solirubrobacteraceae bacterium]